MKTLNITIVAFLVAVSGCKKDDSPINSGTMTIDNKATPPNYYAYGLHIPTGKKIADINNQPDVIIISVDFEIDYTVRKLFISSNNFTDSFFRFGEYGNENSAKQAFTNLKSFTVPSWKGLADSVKSNQIWLFKTSDEKYAKIRVISTFTEKRQDMPFPYAECTVEWVYQPDGTQTFSGK